jgi:hypothetical protein
VQEAWQERDVQRSRMEDAFLLQPNSAAQVRKDSKQTQFCGLVDWQAEKAEVQKSYPVSTQANETWITTKKLFQADYPISYPR